jgi:hypothetical protein
VGRIAKPFPDTAFISPLPLFHSKAPGLRDDLQPFLFERRYRNNATATSPTIFIDFAETLSIVSSSVW